MDTTIRNLDDGAYRELKARAALEGRSIGEVLSEAIRMYTATGAPGLRRGHFADFRSERFPKGNERLSEEIDKVVYGA